MKTTTTEYKKVPCSRCGGRGSISSFQYHQGGVCFRCGGDRVDPSLVAVEREMTDAEVLVELEKQGFPVILTERAPTGDWLLDLFGTDADEAARVEAMTGARLMLAAL